MVVSNGRRAGRLHYCNHCSSTLHLKHGQKENRDGLIDREQADGSGSGIGGKVGGVEG